jgi:formylglycine-generating enzyme required for sulfatase activity/outer membrane protein assembly factor BamB
MVARYVTMGAAALLVLVCHLPTAAARDDAAVTSRFGHEFPSTFAIKRDWIDFQRAAPPLKVIQSLLEKDAQGKLVVPLGESTYTSVWVTVNRWLTQHPETLSALRVEQNTAAVRQLYVAQRTGNPDRLMAVYRSYPWAAAVHVSQLDSGEGLLRSGRPQLALPYFQDALKRSDDAAVRARAQAGVWLAKAHSADSADAIGAMFRDANPAARYPWFGEQLSASEIQTKLTAGMKPAPPMPALDALSIRTIQLPFDPPWMGWTGYLNPTTHELAYRHKVQPVVSGQGTFVAGPCLLAWYSGGALDKPTWSKIATMDIHQNRGHIPPTPSFAPLMVDGRMIVRCGGDLAPVGRKRTRCIAQNHHASMNIDFLEYIAAFDQHSGQMIWSTKDNPDWNKFFPVNAPVYHDGRLYLLALLKKAVKVRVEVYGEQFLLGGKEPIFLLIADADTGRVLKQQELLAYHRNFKAYNPTPGKREPPMQNRKLNLSAGGSQRGRTGHTQLNVYGSQLTVRDGAVYISTAMGAVARCDARDGLIEWITVYPQLSPHLHDTIVIQQRHPLPPLVSDRVVILSSSDSVAVMAMDRETGGALWQKTEIEETSAEESNEGPADGQLRGGSLEALGLFGDSVLVTFDHKIAALEAATGKVRWSQDLGAPVERPIKIVGTTLYVATATNLLKIDGATGKTLDSRVLTPLRTDNGFVFDDKGLIIVKPGKNGITAYVNFPRGENPFPETKPDPVKPKDKAEPAKEISVDLGSGIMMKMVLIPTGSFIMGDARGERDENPVHTVNITEPFYMAKHELTQDQWSVVMNGKAPGQFQNPQHPVESVDGTQVVAFMKSLNEKLDGKPFTGKHPNDPAGKPGTYRLPTEAQWEYACRAGSSTRYHFGDDPKDLGQYAWFHGNSKGNSHPVGQKKPNAWGLYDMHGNVWEMCRDEYYADYYTVSPKDDPRGPITHRHFSVVRGGGWNYSAKSCRAGDRGYLVLTHRRNRGWQRSDNLGLRVTRSVEP